MLLPLTGETPSPPWHLALNTQQILQDPPCPLPTLDRRCSSLKKSIGIFWSDVPHFSTSHRPNGHQISWEQSLWLGKWLKMNVETGMKWRKVSFQDAGQYKCRVDYHLQQTSFQLLDLSVIVPPQMPVIYYNNQPGRDWSEIGLVHPGKFSQGNVNHNKWQVTEADTIPPCEL